MEKKALIVLFLLPGLLAACLSPTPTTPPTAAFSAGGSTAPTQTALPTFTASPSPTLTPTRLPSPETTLTETPGSGFHLQQAAQIGGAIHGITVVGDVAYAGMGPRVAEVDISQHTQPKLIRQSEPLPGLVTLLVQVSGGPAPILLVSAGKYLVVVDTSQPGELKPVQQLELEGAVSALVWDNQESMAYVGGAIFQAPDRYTGYIAAVAFTPGSGLHITSKVEMPERPLSLAYGAGSLFAGAEGYEGGLYYTQVKSPGELSAPQLVIASTPIEPLQPLQMQVIGEHLYLSYRSLIAYDITDPVQPVKTWEVNVSGNVVKGFSFSEDQVYYSGWTILSESVRGAARLPEPVTGSPGGLSAIVTALHNGDFLVAYQDLQLFKPADPQAFQLLGSWQAPVINAIGAAANEETVFVLDSLREDGPSNAILRAFHLPDFAPLGQVMTEIPGEYGFKGIAADGDRVYAASKDSVYVYGVSQPEPVLLGKAGFGSGDLESIAIIPEAGRRLLVIAQKTSDSSLITAYDLADPHKPTQVGESIKLEKGEVVQMVWNGQALYAVHRPAFQYKFVMLHRISFENEALILEESLQAPGIVAAMAVGSGKIALIGSEMVSIISAPDAGPLVLLSQEVLPEVGVGAAITDDTLLVAIGDEYSAAQLLAFDIHDPALTVIDGAVDIPTSNLYTVPILVIGHYILLANGAAGVDVFEIVPGSVP